MKATLIRYSAKELSNTESSKLSKALIGYRDQSNNGRYTYERKGIVTEHKHIIVGRSTFIVESDKSEKIISYIKKKGASILSWDIEVPSEYFK